MAAIPEVISAKAPSPWPSPGTLYLETGWDHADRRREPEPAVRPCGNHGDIGMTYQHPDLADAALAQGAGPALS